MSSCHLHQLHCHGSVASAEPTCHYFLCTDHFKEAVSIVGETEEKPHFYFANFMDQLMIDARRRQSSAKVRPFKC